jgi:hypothetical protein
MWVGCVVLGASLSIAPGCLLEAEPPDEEHRLDDELVVLAPGLSRHRLLEDDDIVGAAGFTVAHVQRLLEHYGSALAGYQTGGSSAAELIMAACQEFDISPLYMLARMETESGIIRSGTLAHLSAATGCGCPDTAGCDPQYASFADQTRCAAQKMRGYLPSLDQTGQTISGWRVGVGKNTLDPCWVVPENRATAALYTYTPWVGAYAAGCGTSQWGGSSLVAVLHRMITAQHAELEEAAGAVIIVDNDNALNDPAVAQSQLSSSWWRTAATPGFFGQDYAVAMTEPISDTAVFRFYLDRAGPRRVQARWTAGSNRSPRVSYFIHDATGAVLAVAEVDQQRDGGRWNTLGTFSFSRGWNEVRLSRWAAPGAVVIADAIRVE